MTLNDLKKNIFVNLLSFSGYIYVALIIWVHFFIRPEVMSVQGSPETDTELVGMVNSSFYIQIVFFLIIIFFITTLMLILIALIENLLRKNKKIPEIKSFNNHFYWFFFSLGLILQLSPIVFIIFTFFTRA